MGTIRRLRGAWLVPLAALPFWAVSSAAATFTVTKTVDTADGSCDADCSLREAVIAANGSAGADVISLPAGTYDLSIAGGAEFNSATGDLDVLDDLTIQGAGLATTIVDAQGLDRVLEIDPLGAGIQVDVDGVTFRGGQNDFGGGIFNAGTLSLTGCRVTGNSATNGGGIQTTGPLSLTNSEIQTNSATTTGPTNNGFGGGIFVSPGGSATLIGSSLVGNTASRDGAGIYNQGVLDIDGGSLTGNVAGATGGAIANLATLDIDTALIQGNAGEDGGGVANFSAGVATLNGVQILDNDATGTETLGGGGGLFNFLGTMHLTGCTVNSNVALGEGGGGLISSGTLTVGTSTFDGNQAQLHGGTLPPTTGGPGFGGAMLLIAGGSATLTSSTLVRNVAGKNGGGIYNDRQTTLVLNSTTLDQNTAQTLFGGGLYNEGGVTFQGGTVTANTSGSNGGGITSNTSFATLTMTGTTVSGNNAGINGGGIYSQADASIDLTGVQLRDNDATQFGGGVQNESDGSLTACVIESNDAPDGGGGLFNALGADLSVTGGEITRNTTSISGAGVFNGGALQLDGVRIADNVATTIGGGMLNSGGTAELTQCTVSGNQAGDGGGLGNFNSGMLTVRRSLLRANQATNLFGGGIHGNAMLAVENSTFSGNTAPSGGGGISHSTGASASIRQATFTGNAATSGDAQFGFQATVSLGNSLVDGTCNLVQTTLTSLGGNLESPGDTCGLTDASDQVDVSDPGLGPLAANGGAPHSHSLGPGSPAIDAALAAICLAVDQRGAARPFDGDGNLVADCDVGAIEVPEPGLPAVGSIVLLTLALLAGRRRP